jgi:hypothetical protein
MARHAGGLVQPRKDLREPRARRLRPEAGMAVGDRPQYDFLGDTPDVP